MTTLAGIQGNGWCAIGADSRMVDSGQIYELPKDAGKIHKVNGYIIAIAGDFRVAQIMNHSFQWPKMPTFSSVEATDKFFTTELIPMWKAEYEDLGYTVDKDTESSVLVAVSGVIYAIDQDWSWGRDKRGLYAAGSGSDYALGRLDSFVKPKNSDEAAAQIKAAIKTASKYDINTAEPIIVYTQESK